MSDEYGHRLKGFTLRLDEDLKELVINAAKTNNLSESDEIRTRLRWSFEEERQAASDIEEMKKSLKELHSKLDLLINKEG